jgi:ectoine hydroxylase-related dioxygenase (phytanoyl-CoA dioxygenase family)
MLTDDQIIRYHQDGFLVVEGLLVPAEVVRVGERADQLALGTIPRVGSLFREPGKTGAARKLMGLVPDDEVMTAHANHPKLLAVAAALLGVDDLRISNDQLFMKSAFHGSAKQWHRDSQRADIVTAWSAIDEATIENGCLLMIPGSHCWGSRPVTADEKALAVPIELAVGSVSFHHGLTLHSSGANTTSKRRRGYATQYTPSVVLVADHGNRPRISPRAAKHRSRR